MKDIFMFCENNPECVCDDLCCQECSKNKDCDHRCPNIRLKERVYSDKDYHAQLLDDLAERTDNWLIAVAAERIRKEAGER